jgi:hypothetical protein
MACEMPVTMERPEMAADMHRMSAHAAAPRAGRKVWLHKDQHRKGRGRREDAFQELFHTAIIQ